MRRNKRASLYFVALLGIVLASALCSSCLMVPYRAVYSYNDPVYLRQERPYNAKYGIELVSVNADGTVTVKTKEGENRVLTTNTQPRVATADLTNQITVLQYHDEGERTRWVWFFHQ